MSVANYLRQASNVKPSILNVCANKFLKYTFNSMDLDVSYDIFDGEYSDIFLFDRPNEQIFQASKENQYLAEEINVIQYVDSAYHTEESLLLDSKIQNITHVFNTYELDRYYQQNTPFIFKNREIIRDWVDTDIFYDKEQERKPTSCDLKMMNGFENIVDGFNNYTTYLQRYDVTNSVPLHAMACGCIPILVNELNLHNTSVLRSGDNCVIVESMEEALEAAEMLNNNKNLAQNMRQDIKDAIPIINKTNQDDWQNLLK